MDIELSTLPSKTRCPTYDMAEDQKKLQELSDAYQKIQTDLQTTVSARQRLESQQQENKGVQKVHVLPILSTPLPRPRPSSAPLTPAKEFSTLPSTSAIYKLVGPVLLKQERSEAVMAVEGRLDFIDREIKRLEKQIQETQTESESKKMEVYQLQTQMQGQE
ncbi:hypothetical protein HO173_006218 [Letharia columbiana]|uniref:Prefoldin subunit 6 n=1 Tax=Letharia columbiana TaxID=112416 RepID=A0A8H6L4Q9_9LECA|nr:uncharacterized protein HO173_006218 [Letharia columbiana]KAF6235535.1 hypothetical protein HO173_006218 [Letharia columbiana]